MPNLDRKRLPNRVRAGGTTAPGGCAVIFGLPFLALGSFIAAAASGYFPDVAAIRYAMDEAQESFRASRTVVTVFGGVLAGVGLWMASRGMVGYVRNAGVRGRKSERPGEPWYWDHPWNAEGVESDGGPLEQLQGLVELGLWTLLLTPLTWLACTNESWGWLALVAILDLAILYSYGLALYKFVRSLQHGRGRLRFGSFPFFLGGSVDVELLDVDRLRGFTSMTVSLRCIHEIYDPVPSLDENETARLICYQIYEDQKTLTPGANPIAGPDLRISFPLPDGEYATRLGESPQKCWELEIKADLPGIDYAATFLVPVYARPKQTPH